MSKDFQKWHAQKKGIDTNGNRPFFHEREVWWCSLGVNVGFEQDGKGDQFSRPVLILKKFNKEVFWALPLSTKIKTSKFYRPVDLHDGINRVAILSQIRLTDAKRLGDKIGVVSAQNYAEIQKAVIKLLGS